MEMRSITDTLIMVILMAVFSVIMLTNMTPFLKDTYGGFGTLIEKTAPSTPSEIEPIPRNMQFQDIALIFLVADQYQPDPKKVTLVWGSTGQTKEIIFNDTFFNNKQAHVSAVISASNHLPINHTVKMDLRSGINGIRDWRVLIQ